MECNETALPKPVKLGTSSTVTLKPTVNGYLVNVTSLQTLCHYNGLWTQDHLCPPLSCHRFEAHSHNRRMQSSKVNKSSKFLILFQRAKSRSPARESSWAFCRPERFSASSPSSTTAREQPRSRVSGYSRATLISPINGSFRNLTHLVHLLVQFTALRYGNDRNKKFDTTDYPPVAHLFHFLW